MKLNSDANIVIVKNKSDGSTKVLRQLSDVTKIIAQDNDFNGSSEFTKTSDTVNEVDIIIPGAKIGDMYYADLKGALKNAKNNDTIEMINDFTWNIPNPGGNIGAVSIDKSVTVKGGVFNISDVQNAYCVFGISGENVNVTFEGSTFQGTDYNSGYGVIYVSGGATVTLKDCLFNLEKDGHEWGGVLKGENYDKATLNIDNSKFYLSNIQRVICNATVNITNTIIEASCGKKNMEDEEDTTDYSKYVNNAFRNICGTILNSNITASGFENGIKNDVAILLELKDNTTVKISGSAEKDGVQGYDLILKNGANVNIDNTSALVVTTVSKDENENTGINLGGKDGNYNKAGDVFALVFDLNGGTGVSNKMFEKNTNVNLSQYVPSKNGYRFLGWYSDKDLTKAVVNVKMTSNTTVYAKWYEIYTPSSSGGITTTKFTVNFDSNGGSDVESQSVARSTKVKEPIAPTKSGFKFNGWYTDKNCTKKYDFTTRVKADFTLYAGWTIGNVEVQPEVNKNAIVLTIGKNVATVFGESKTNDVAPIIRNDRTMLPARFAAESLGAKVEWNEELQQVTITKDDVTIVITIGSDKVLVNGEEKTIDSPAFIENDRTYTPIRFICEELGADVDWNETTQTVTITKK